MDSPFGDIKLSLFNNPESKICFFTEISMDILECCIYDNFEDYINNRNLNVPLNRRYQDFISKLRIIIEVQNISKTIHLDDSGVEVNIKPSICYPIHTLPQLFKAVAAKRLKTLTTLLSLSHIHPETAHHYRSVSIY